MPTSARPQPLLIEAAINPQRNVNDAMDLSRFLPIAAVALIASASAAAAQDAAAGEHVFRRCRACHEVGEDARNMVGPVLNGVVDRPAGSIADYHYSDANKSSGLVWDDATLTAYLRNPQGKVPGTKMAFPGLTSDADIANVIAYLKQFDGNGKKR